MGDTAILKFNPEGTEGEYRWTCPACGHEQPEWPDDQEYEQTITATDVLCENCDKWFDYVKEGEA
jgi:phage terminase large subunit GpA-like protein